MDSCDECGFVYDEQQVGPIDVRLREIGPAFRSILGADDDALRRRPAPEVWSALEYACHVRDVLLVQRDRIYVTLVEDTPSFPPMYRDERVGLAHYNEQDPAAVADHLDVASELIAGAFAVLDDEQLARGCRYAYPVPAVRSLRWVGLHTVHEGQHHAQDARRSLGA